MNSLNNILIVDDNPRLSEQLIELVVEVLPKCNWDIHKSDNYHSAIRIIDSIPIKILVSDLYLEPNENKHTPSGIKLAKYLKQQQPDCFIYIVSSNLNLLISRNQLIEYIDIGVNDFLDRNVDPIEKFIQKFQYQLQKIDQSIISINSFTYKFWQAQDIKTYESFWILILDCNERKYDNLIANCIIWEKTIPEPGAAFSLLHIYDLKTRYLQENSVLNDSDSYPFLLISDMPQLDNIIQISSKTLGIIKNESESQNRNYLKQLLNKIHIKIRAGTTISEIKNEIVVPKFWSWLNLDNIQSFSLETGSLILQDNTTINTPITINQNNSRRLNISARTINASGAGAFPLGDINGQVANTINQSPSFDAEPDKKELKELLSELRTAVIEAELDEEDCENALEQIQVIAKALQESQNVAMKKTAKTAMKVLQDTATVSPLSEAMVNICNQLPDLISKTF